MPATLNDALTLPSGLRLKNRLVKAAMTEGLANARNEATPALAALYRRWSEGGAGGLITGNIQIDPDHLERAGNVVIGRTMPDAAAEALARWAEAGKSGGAAMILQVNHAGRQTPKLINPAPAAPSAVPLDLPGGQFGRPREMTEGEIAGVIEGFGRAAAAARAAGFDGVQVHAAHGYLLSQFLSPRSNQRTDGWGGSLAARARLLIECVKAVQSAGGQGFSVSVKLNSADFQKGGFSFEDCLEVIHMLETLHLDFIEISGGNYEQPRMMDIDGLEPVENQTIAPSTRLREAYFLDYACAVRTASRTALMVTGGFRTRRAMDEALGQGACDLIGLGRPLCVDTAAPARLLSGEAERLDGWEHRLRIGPGLLGPGSPLKLIRALNGFGAQGWYYEQLKRLGQGREPDTSLGVFPAFLAYQRGEREAAKARQRS